MTWNPWTLRRKIDFWKSEASYYEMEADMWKNDTMVERKKRIDAENRLRELLYKEKP